MRPRHDLQKNIFNVPVALCPRKHVSFLTITLQSLPPRVVQGGLKGRRQSAWPIDIHVESIMLSLFRALMPKEERFFDLFAEQAGFIVDAAEALREMVRAGDDLEGRFQVIHEVEGRADTATKAIQMAVHRSFIVPFDRSDIQDLAKRMDDMVDLIQDVARHLAEAGPMQYTAEMHAMTDAILQAAKVLNDLVPLLRDIPRNVTSLTRMTDQISRLESESDRLLRAGKARLRQESGGLDAPITYRQALVREIMELMESVLDAGEDVADIIDSIIVDHV